MAEGYVQSLTYKHCWKHKETAALGEKIWSTLSAWLPSYKQYLYHSYFGFSAFFCKQVKLLQLTKPEQSGNTCEFKNKSVYTLHLISVVRSNAEIWEALKRYEI